MNKHEEARKNYIINMKQLYGDDYLLFSNVVVHLNYIASCEATEKELEIYKQLHQKYQYLNENTNDYDLNVDEVTTIHDVIYELEEKIQR